MASAPVAPSASAVTPAARLDSLDLLRGLVMVVMALDHTRDFFHFGALHGVNPTDVATTTPAIFLTRWVTHFCAPIFSFLAGTGISLSLARGKPKGELSRFLLIRGLWLIIVETLLVWFGWDFNFHPMSYVLATLWSLGWSMIFLAGLIHVPVWVAGTFGAVLILGHNAFDGIRPESWGAWAWLWQVLHVPGLIKSASGFTLIAMYPLIPWIGVMAAGYAFGAVFRLEPLARRTWLWRIGSGLIVLFVVLRFSNLYGNLTPWASQPRTGFTLFSFLDCSKYPPSLCYLLMTLGPGILFLALFDRTIPSLLKPLIVYGRVPFFYYALHIPLLHALSYALNRVQFGRADFTAITLGVPPPPEAGVNLLWVYLIWLSVVLALYPACRWFAELKRRRRDWIWLSYF